ncbi:2-aminoethylphosphonate--pyruvate transaminase [Vreelandella venusta]|uniref:2-aminoethylphosphonate--pyruvate transaminase n=1 Tax=Vreelandella venusta TaxID=44935 RepID=A0ABX2BBE0_9GAMM|nr:2-aminoethylphosphonate--pyruvate transaminase [Halomonas venusta]AZM97439.1 2-aminoethylphosphonate--pyruvate transaminase [Halomonas venusta]MDW0358838.1 2-aminoethylphosphonate--pyruvate transaminase [Halomonas venusta]NPT31327.1 2-aminoethylphosphonate--pyruvate transaminase [Halomonas venusta]UQI40205.1 2-aminoethylphosphonate--pyruvate transaminase [Halomonas venusta]
MMNHSQAPYLLTPGPLTTSHATKAAMLRDWGSWDDDFNRVTADVRAQLLAMAEAASDVYACVPMQGSGTFAVESALACATDPNGKVLVLMNGAYGKRAAQLLDMMGRRYVTLDKGDYLPPQPDEVAALLQQDADITAVFLVHCETSSGILNPLEAIAEVVRDHGKTLIVDAMSSFGGVPISLAKTPIDVLISSANKCIEGVPGFGFVIIRQTLLAAGKGRAHSLSLDLHAQWDYMERTGQWRFTPPTHTVVAFQAALAQHREEGGVAGRCARYTHNRDALVKGMRALGFSTLLEDEWLSPIITTFLSPSDPAFEFKTFYAALKTRGFLIYPGKLTDVDSFRIGCIGQLDTAVVEQLLSVIQDALTDMNVSLFTESRSA